MLGLGYLTWSIWNLASLYWLGWGAMKLINSKGMSEFVFLLSMGVLMLFGVVMMSFLTFALIAQIFGDKKVSEKIEKSLPDFLK